MTEEKQKCERQNMVGPLLWKKKSFKVGFERVQAGFCQRGRGMLFRVGELKMERAREPTVEKKSDTRLLEAESIAGFGNELAGMSQAPPPQQQQPLHIKALDVCRLVIKCSG